jgi:membrane-bound serine protease (ClpP class)
MSGDDAVDAHLLNDAAPTLVDFLGDLSGHVSGVDLGVTGPSGPSGVARGFRKDLTFDFSQLSILPKLLHTAASPDVAFVMLLIALALVVFEFFTAGVGVAAATGVVFGVLSSYGLGVLPTHWWAVALLCLSVLGFAVDVQAGSPRFWTAVGLVAYAVGAVGLYGGGQSVSLWIVVVMGLLVALFMINGMPAMVRTRFSTPTIGRESLIGTLGVAVSGVEPEGTVKVNGAPWRARTNRATPIPAGEIIRVVAIDGLLLEVEPETGGAHDAHH